MDRYGLSLLVAIGLPLASAPLLALAGRRLGARVGWVALALPVLSTAALLHLAASGPAPIHRVVEWPWIPSLGINLSFLVDGLSLFFALIVSGMGSLIVFYATHYLEVDAEHHGRFYCYLVVFMAAMLGTVLANNLLLLFVFWELTGVASFLLIGFLYADAPARIGARQALLVTVATGLAMLAGIVMLYTVTGTYDFTAIAAGGLPVAEHGVWLSVALCLLVAGAFGKSAQFPLHFWLPNAMAAPTPVSAYLHSATMVKLGVFLCARFFPVFADQAAWSALLSVIPFTTMLLGAVLALLSHDLKAILAYSTVSQLGYLLGYYGLGAPSGVAHDYLHILNHVFFKGGLFMIAGIVSHATGVRDIRQLGGLFHRMPLLGAITLVATAAMAGLPGTTGFLSKEMMLKEIFEAPTVHGAVGMYAAVCVVLTSILKVAFSIRLFANIFLGREPEAIGHHFHAPSLWMQLPPLFLATCALAGGIAPPLLDAVFSRLSVAGLHQPAHLSLWHGFTKEVATSMSAVGLGFVLYLLGVRSGWRWHVIPRWLQFDRVFEAGVDRFTLATKHLTRALRSDEPVAYLPIILGFVVITVGGSLAWSVGAEADLRRLLAGAEWPAPNPLRLFIAAIIAVAVIGVVALRRWTTQVITLSVAGFLLCFYFVLYRAPDLALTQILVEVVTLFMILLLLSRFPHPFATEPVYRHGPGRKALNAIIATGVGCLTAGLVVVYTAAPPSQRLGQLFLDTTVPLAEGSNAVNTVLVDFRGFDTLGEITVLVIAMLGALGLMMRYSRTLAGGADEGLAPPAAGHSPGDAPWPGERSARPPA